MKQALLDVGGRPSTRSTASVQTLHTAAHHRSYEKSLRRGLFSAIADSEYCLVLRGDWRTRDLVDFTHPGLIVLAYRATLVAPRAWSALSVLQINGLAWRCATGVPDVLGWK